MRSRHVSQDRRSRIFSRGPERRTPNDCTLSNGANHRNAIDASVSVQISNDKVFQYFVRIGWRNWRSSSNGASTTVTIFPRYLRSQTLSQWKSIALRQRKLTGPFPDLNIITKHSKQAVGSMSVCGSVQTCRIDVGLKVLIDSKCSRIDSPKSELLQVFNMNRIKVFALCIPQTCRVIA